MAANAMSAEILELNRRAFDEENFELAYHLLAAALHAAEDDVDIIDVVIDEATVQAEAIDARPGHPLSMERAEQRGTTPLFRSLVKTAQAKRAHARAALALEHHKVSDPHV